MLSLVLLAAGVANAPSFACGLANSPVEAVICGNPELAAYDRAMALAYPRMKPAARATQKAWLAERDQCGGARKVIVCLRRSYTDRLLMDGGLFANRTRTSAAHVSTFARRKDDGPGGLTLVDVGGGKLVYRLWSTYYSYARDPDHPQDISGDTFGVIDMNGGIGREIATRECDFTLRRRGAGWVISDAGPCLGMNNNPDGTYLPRRR